MKLKKIAILAVSFSSLLACADVEKINESVAEINNAESEILQQCLDSKMEHWYRAFNRYQLEGYNMFAADLKALQEANAVYESCRKQRQGAAASSTAELR
jgi:hypothetical protein